MHPSTTGHTHEHNSLVHTLTPTGKLSVYNQPIVHVLDSEEPDIPEENPQALCFNSNIQVFNN